MKLEIQEPGEKNFKPAKTATQIIQVNDYNEKTNATAIKNFPLIFTSFGYLKKVGDVKFRINISDGQCIITTQAYGIIFPSRVVTASSK